MEAFLISITSVALGELGDRTQLLALILATQLRRPLAVLLGILVATFANHLLAAFVGQWARTFLGPGILRWTLGISFLVLAAWALIPEKAERAHRARARRLRRLHGDRGRVLPGRDG